MEHRKIRWRTMWKRRHLRTLRQRLKRRIRIRHKARYGLDLRRKFKALGKVKKRYYAYDLVFPATLDFVQNLEETLRFFNSLKQLIYSIRPDRIRIDHSALETLSPEAALVLTAEITKGNHLKPKCRMAGNSAKNPSVHELLGQVGYWDYFIGMKWKKSITNSKDFLQLKDGKLTKGPVVKALVQHFAPEAKLDQAQEKALYSAIIECMDNVMKHAYDPSHRKDTYYNHWWMLGYRDTARHEVSFCFYDQGLGIAKTIRTRLKDRTPFIAPTDSALIVKAVVEGNYSSTQNPTRGRGLPRLKKFIDNAKAGNLMIVSRNSRCTFDKASSTQLDFRAKFGGTLIVWTLQNEHEN